MQEFLMPDPDDDLPLEEQNRMFWHWTLLCYMWIVIWNHPEYFILYPEIVFTAHVIIILFFAGVKLSEILATFDNPTRLL